MLCYLLNRELLAFYSKFYQMFKVNWQRDNTLSNLGKWGYMINFISEFLGLIIIYTV